MQCDVSDRFSNTEERKKRTAHLAARRTVSGIPGSRRAPGWGPQAQPTAATLHASHCQLRPPCSRSASPVTIWACFLRASVWLPRELSQGQQTRSQQARAWIEKCVVCNAHYSAGGRMSRSGRRWKPGLSSHRPRVSQERQQHCDSTRPGPCRPLCGPTLRVGSCHCTAVTRPLHYQTSNCTLACVAYHSRTLLRAQNHSQAPSATRL